MRAYTLFCGHLIDLFINTKIEVNLYLKYIFVV